MSSLWVRQCSQKKKILWQGSSGEREKGESHQTSCRNKRGLPKTKTIPSRLKHPSHKHTATSHQTTQTHIHTTTSLLALFAISSFLHHDQFYYLRSLRIRCYCCAASKTLGISTAAAAGNIFSKHPHLEFLLLLCSLSNLTSC